jgi:hypothetical protein
LFVPPPYTGAVQPVPLAALWPAGPAACCTGGSQAQAKAQGERGGLPGGTGGSFSCLPGLIVCSGVGVLVVPACDRA